MAYWASKLWGDQFRWTEKVKFYFDWLKQGRLVNLLSMFPHEQLPTCAWSWGVHDTGNR